MFFRAIILCVFIICCTSCNKLSFSKSVKINPIDTVVDFSSVDVSPSFKVCDFIINKSKKTNCFRTTIHKKIGAELTKHLFTIKDSISEIVFVNLIINAKGGIVLEDIQAPENIKKELPALDSLLKVSVEKLPVIYPAIKRGIPVTTKYRLPIRIQLKE